MGYYIIKKIEKLFTLKREYQITSANVAMSGVRYNINSYLPPINNPDDSAKVTQAYAIAAYQQRKERQKQDADATRERKEQEDTALREFAMRSLEEQKTIEADNQQRMTAWENRQKHLQNCISVEDAIKMNLPYAKKAWKAAAVQGKALRDDVIAKSTKFVQEATDKTNAKK